CSPAFRIARQEAPAPEPTRTAAGDSSDAGARGGPGPEPRLRPYNQVITSRAATREGLFKVHQIGARLYYEIPRAELDRDMLLVTQIAKNSVGEGYGGEAVGNRVLRWERR